MENSKIDAYAVCLGMIFIIFFTLGLKFFSIIKEYRHISEEDAIYIAYINEKCHSGNLNVVAEKFFDELENTIRENERVKKILLEKGASHAIYSDLQGILVFTERKKDKIMLGLNCYVLVKKSNEITPLIKRLYPKDG